ncbi:hypothetical protein ABZ488_27455 [Streptomyces griseus]|uniref:hypothetical protein n=1 Tax=Streptomyces griseus TaxID=1911 RepID=UPI0033FCEAEB
MATGIDPRSVGPYRLATAEKTALRKHADQAVRCLRAQAVIAHVTVAPGRRPSVSVANDPGGQGARACHAPVLDRLTATEQAALKTLEKLTAPCLRRRHLSPITLSHDFTWRFTAPATSAPTPEARSPTA